MKHLFWLSSVVLFSGHTFAGGLYLYEIGTDDLGLAGAGQAARAQDAATLFTNPAGMTLLPDRSLSLGGQALYGDAPYRLSDDAQLKGKSPGNVIGWFPGGSAFYTQKIAPDITAGIGLYGNYGLGLHFGDWAGENLVKDSTLLALTLMPAVAWQYNDALSFGAGLGINYGILSLKRQNVQGDTQEQSDHDWALNAKVGALYQFNKQTRAGITYTSRTDYHFNINSTLQLSQLNNSLSYTLPIAATVNTPQQVMASLYHDFNDRWAIMGDIGWQDWSEYSNSEIRVSGRPVSGHDRLRDTWHLALGTQFRATDEWTFNTGVAFDSSFYRNQNDTSLTMPSGDTWRWGVGTRYQLDKTSSIGAAFEYAHIDSSHVASPLLEGGYDTPALYFFGVNYNRAF
ncbi:outer membrane protein transport protein [Erwinia sp. E_sp_B04_7]|uniref:OmpP1/FadL family transporter n=1 Tax=unclassified Erwinia TaxID=2622719 RepID=UPI0030CD0050